MGRRSEKVVDRRKGRGKGHGLKKASSHAEALRDPHTLVNRLKPKETPEELIAEMVVSGLVPNAVTAAQFSKLPLGDVDLTACVAKLHAAVGCVQRGDLETQKPC